MTAVTGNTEYHIVMTGGAAAGCVIAARLSEDGTHRVLLPEAGARPPEPDARRRARRPAAHRPARLGIRRARRRGVARALPRGKLQGECSSTNATFALCGHPADYRAGAQAANNEWSFDAQRATPRTQMHQNQTICVLDRTRGTNRFCSYSAISLFTFWNVSRAA
jgi:choline dehydrogenase-like flavoprotein